MDGADLGHPRVAFRSIAGAFKSSACAETAPDASDHSQLCGDRSSARGIQLLNRFGIQLQRCGCGQIGQLQLIRRAGNRSRNPRPRKQPGQRHARRRRSACMGNFIQRRNGAEHSARNEVFSMATNAERKGSPFASILIRRCSPDSQL